MGGLSNEKLDDVGGSKGKLMGPRPQRAPRVPPVDPSGRGNCPWVRSPGSECNAAVAAVLDMGGVSHGSRGSFVLSPVVLL